MFITEYLNRDKQKVDALVDLTFKTTLMRDGLLNPYMPLVSYDSRDLLILKFTALPTIAYLVAEDADIPYGAAQVFLDEQHLGNLKLAKARGYTGRDFEAFNKMLMQQAMAGPAARAAFQAMNDYFFSQPATLVDQIVDLHTVLQLQTYCTGKCNYVDPLTEVPAKVDYTSTIPTGNMPAALTGNARWSQSATANPIRNLRDHARSFFEVNRFYPRDVVMSMNTWWRIQECQSVRQETAQLRGIVVPSTDSSNLASITPPDKEEVERILSRQVSSEMRIVLFDETYNVEQRDGTITEKVPFLPPDYYFFGIPGMGERAVVPTIEKNFQPGVYTESKVLDTAPRRERTLALANGIPFVKDGRLLAARNTENTAINVA